MNLPPKEITCKCGHLMVTKKDSDWCDKCGNHVFYHAKDQRTSKIHTYYVWAIFIVVATFLTYLYLELVAAPLMK